MKCEFHPSAPASATCEKCQVALCGFCSNLVGDKVFCEKCGDDAQLESFVDQRSAKEPTRVDSLLSEAETAVTHIEAKGPVSRRYTGIKQTFHIAAVLISCAIITYQIATSFSGQRDLSLQDIVAQDRTRNQIEACMLVFWEIAALLDQGRTPGENLRCEDTGLPMIVADIDGDLRISHPRPDLLGLSDIYVTRSNPIPILVE